MKSMLPERVETVRRIVAGLQDRPGPLSEVLHAIQAAVRSAIKHFPEEFRAEAPLKRAG